MNDFKDPEREVTAAGERNSSADSTLGESADELQPTANGESQAAAGDSAGDDGDRSSDAERPNGEDPSDGEEVDVLRSELMRLQEELSEANERLQEMKDRYLRARADLENYRKRAAGDAERAREAGLDSAVLPVLSVFDDLHRALGAADEADPAKIIPGIQSVLATLERNLDALGIRPVGSVGDAFDPDLHEALTSVPTDEVEKTETIAEVFQLGFQKGDRLIRPARVVVYQG